MVFHSTHLILIFALSLISSQHAYEVPPRKDHRGVNLISNVQPFGRLWSQTQTLAHKGNFGSRELIFSSAISARSRLPCPVFFARHSKYEPRKFLQEHGQPGGDGR
jgi:hypothetical protein